jgi:hypothetical protein
MYKTCILCLAVAGAAGAAESDASSAAAAVARIVDHANARARAGEPAAMIEADMRAQLRAGGVVLEDAAEPPAWDAYGRALARRARQHGADPRDITQPSSTTLNPR